MYTLLLVVKMGKYFFHRPADGKVVLIILTFVFCFCTWIFLKRVVSPDLAFDSINYHFFVGKSGFENFPKPFKVSEFFPMGMHSFNPLIDTIQHLFYLMGGYRLGTLPSFLSLLAVIALTLAIVRLVASEKLNIWALLFIFPAIVVNEAFFQVATYFTDNVYALLVLLYLYLILNLNKNNVAHPMFSLIMPGVIGGLIATKLTNLMYLIPLSLVTIVSTATTRDYFNVKKKWGIKYHTAGVILVYSLSFMAVVGYHFYFAFVQTGNPVFPYYNSVFKSIFFPPVNWEFNFGPRTWHERFFYPYFVFSNPVLLGEVKDFFPDLKLITGMLMSFVAFIFVIVSGIRFSRNESIIFFVTYLSYVIWQVLFGYSRYAIALEFLIGISLVILANKIFSMPRRWLEKSGLVVFLFFQLWQSAHILRFNSIYDIAWRPNIGFSEWSQRIQSPHLFSSYTSVDAETSKLLGRVDVVVQCVNPSSAYALTIVELMNKPLLNFDIGSNGAITLNEKYIEVRDLRLIVPAISMGNNVIKFAIVINDTNKGLRSREGCMNAIAMQASRGHKLIIDSELSINNFVGDDRQTLTVFLGSYALDRDS